MHISLSGETEGLLEFASRWLHNRTHNSPTNVRVSSMFRGRPLAGHSLCRDIADLAINPRHCLVRRVRH